MGILIAIECDLCRFVAEDIGGKTIAAVRANARRAGWMHDKGTGRDYCQECRPPRPPLGAPTERTD